MNRTVRTYLIDLARNPTNSIVHYQILCDACSLPLRMRENPQDRLEIGRILEVISVHEHERERPLLSSLVVSSGSFEEGNGFYKMCQKIGYGEWQALKRNERFAFEHMERCWLFWQNNNNYIQFRND